MTLKELGNTKKFKTKKCKYCKEKIELNDDNVEKINGRTIITCPHCYNEMIQ